MTDAAQHSPKNPALRLGLALAASGTVGAFVHEAGTDPFTTVFWRCVFGAGFLFAWSLAFGYLRLGTLNRATIVRAAIAGVFLALCWIGLFSGFTMTSIATATLVFQSYPFLLVLAGAVFLQERCTVSQVLWLVLAAGGVALASGALAVPMGGGDTWLLGIGLTLAAAASYVVTTIVTRGIQGQRPEVTMMFQAATGAVILSFLADFQQPISAPSWAWLAGMGVIHSGLVMVAMYSTYPHLSTPIIAIMNFTYPAVAILLDWLVYSHPLTPLQLAGMVLISLATLGMNLKWELWQKPAS